jgi:uncharacterized protein (DUF427 family)
MCCVDQLRAPHQRKRSANLALKGVSGRAGIQSGENMKAVWNSTEIANSDDTVIVEGNHYFPLASVNSDYLRKSDGHSNCPWKGQASYYDIVVGDEVNEGAAWYYSDPKPAAAKISGRVAFWRGIAVSE